MPTFDLSADELTRLAQAEGFDLAGIAALDRAEEQANRSTPANIWNNGSPPATPAKWTTSNAATSRVALLRSQSSRCDPLGALRHRLRRQLQRPRPALHRSRTSQHRLDRPLRLGRRRDLSTGELRPSDYHDTLLARLRALEATLHNRIGEAFESRSYVDTGPLIERDLARQAGIGWTAKNTCTLNQQLAPCSSSAASSPHSMSLPPAVPSPAADRCGTCRRCIEACPTDALIAPGQMDASRCIAYLTIEKRGPIPEELRAPIGRQVFGCDICQEVCPWNQKRGSQGLSQQQLLCRSHPPGTHQPRPRMARRS